MYQLDKNTGKAAQVTSIPTGAAVINWTSAGTPPELAKALGQPAAPIPTTPGSGGQLPNLSTPSSTPTQFAPPSPTGNAALPTPPANQTPPGTPVTPSTPTTPAPTTSIFGMNPPGTAKTTFADMMQKAVDRVSANNDYLKYRQLLIKQLYDQPLTDAEKAQLPKELQDAVGTGDKYEMEMQLRLLNDQITGRAQSLSGSVKYLTDGYNASYDAIQTERQNAIQTIQTFIGQYGSQAPAQLARMFGPDYIARLKDEGIDVAAMAATPTISESRYQAQYGSGTASDFQIDIPPSTIAGRTNNPLNIKFVAGNELGGTDSGIQAQDGGSFAYFQSPQDGLNAAIKLLQSPTYNTLTVDQAMRKWSNGGYGAEVAPDLPPQTKVGDLGQDDMMSLVTDMAQRESGTTLSLAPTVVTSIATGIENGTQPPTLTGLYGKSAAVRAQLSKDGFDLSKATQQWTAAQKLIQSLNGPQQVRFRGLAKSVVNTIDEVKGLADQMKQSGVPALNAAELTTLVQTQGNTPQGQLASQYLTAVNTLKEEFANLANAGYAPTESAWTLANSQINGNYGVDQLKGTLGEVQRLINYRLNALTGAQAVTPGGSTDNAYVSSPTGGSGGGTDYTSVLDGILNGQ